MLRPFTYLIALVLMTLGTTATAQQSSLAGEYAFVPGGSTDLNAVIEQTVAKMSFIKRPIARSRLKKTNAPYQKVSIGVQPSTFSIGFDGGQPIDSPADGRTIQWKRNDGEVFAVSTRMEGDNLIQTFKAEDGQRVNSFHIDADGALTLDVVLTSEQLPAPMKYSLRYRRVQ